jgi:hypothetical protein
MDATRELREGQVLQLAHVLLAVGVRLSEDPAVAAAARTVRTRPLKHAAAAAGWVAQALWNEESRPERVARMGCQGRRWE